MKSSESRVLKRVGIGIFICHKIDQLNWSVSTCHIEQSSFYFVRICLYMYVSVYSLAVVFLFYFTCYLFPLYWPQQLNWPRKAWVRNVFQRVSNSKETLNPAQPISGRGSGEINLAITELIRCVRIEWMTGRKVGYGSWPAGSRGLWWVG